MSIKNTFTLLAMLTSSTVLASGCVMGPDYKAPSMEVGQDFFTTNRKSLSQEDIQKDWWKAFNDSVLDDMIDESIEHNHDIRIALANIEEARALRQETSADYVPSITAEEDATRQGISRKNGSSTSSARKRDTITVGLDASWELDVFGKVKRSVEASDARLQATIEEKNDVLLSILAEVARNYFEVRGLQKRIDVTKRNIELLTEVEHLATSQFKTGVGTEFDVARARGEREAMEATLPNLQADMRAGIYRLSVLSGNKPEYYLATLEQQEPLATPPDVVPVGLRSDLLRRRPDIRQAERELAASNADIGVATAELFPSFSLTGAVGTSARVFSDLFSAGATTFALGETLSWPVFKGGALRAKLAASKAVSKAAAAHYEKTVLEALEDVETALTRYGSEWQTLKRLQEAEQTRKEGFRIAKLRYEAGEENFLVILDAERSLTAIQDDVIQSETRLVTDLTQVYKALGGGWEAYQVEAK